MSVCVSSVFVLSCEDSWLGQGWSHVQGVLPTVYDVQSSELINSESEQDKEELQFTFDWISPPGRLPPALNKLHGAGFVLCSCCCRQCRWPICASPLKLHRQAIPAERDLYFLCWPGFSIYVGQLPPAGPIYQGTNCSVAYMDLLRGRFRFMWTVQRNV
jgi:hypothetical protein